MPRAAKAENVKRQNLSAVLTTLRERGPISRTEIASLLDLNPSTITRLVDELMAEGLIVVGQERGPSTERGGRRPIALELNPDAGSIIGVDLGGTSMAGGVVDLSGKIIARQGARSSREREESLQRLIDLCRELVQSAPDRERIWGVGIGAPSLTLSEDGVVVWAPAFGWRDLPLKALLEDALGLPVFVENDVNLAALGEHTSGAGRGVNNLVVVFIGTGIGAGIILDGKLYRGARQAAGEVGYMLVDVAGLGRRYDEFGCLESLASGTGIADRARAHVQAGRQTALSSLAGGRGEEITAELVFDVAREGDDVALEVVDETVQYLGLAVANIACLLNPEMIVLGGGVARSADMLLDGIRRQVEGVVPDMPRLEASILGKDAVIEGAFAMVMRQISQIDWRIP